jgi:hypothetical protein
LDLFDTHAGLDTIHSALDKRMPGWEPEMVMVMVQAAIGCQEILTSKRATVLQVLPRLEGLLLTVDPLSRTTNTLAVRTKEIAKYTVGQRVQRGQIVSITPDTPGASAGPGELGVVG